MLVWTMTYTLLTIGGAAWRFERLSLLLPLLLLCRLLPR